MTDHDPTVTILIETAERWLNNSWTFQSELRAAIAEYRREEGTVGDERKHAVWCPVSVNYPRRAPYPSGCTCEQDKPAAQPVSEAAKVMTPNELIHAFDELRDVVVGVLRACDTATAQLAAETERGDQCEDLQRSKSPCGHFSVFAASEDGGKTIWCALCRIDSLRAQLDARESEWTAAHYADASEEGYRRAITDWHSNAALVEARDTTIKEQAEETARLNTTITELFRRVDRRGATIKEQFARIEELEREVAVDDELLAERNRVMDALRCPTHGPCVPHALDEIARLRAENETSETKVAAAVEAMLAAKAHLTYADRERAIDGAWRTLNYALKSLVAGGLDADDLGGVVVAGSEHASPEIGLPLGENGLSQSPTLSTSRPNEQSGSNPGPRSPAPSAPDTTQAEPQPWKVGDEAMLMRHHRRVRIIGTPAHRYRDGEWIVQQDGDYSPHRVHESELSRPAKEGK